MLVLLCLSPRLRHQSERGCPARTSAQRRRKTYLGCREGQASRRTQHVLKGSNTFRLALSLNEPALQVALEVTLRGKDVGDELGIV